eukprot:3932088-Rhodomonas_salina.1
MTPHGLTPRVSPASRSQCAANTCASIAASISFENMRRGVTHSPNPEQRPGAGQSACCAHSNLLAPPRLGWSGCAQTPWRHVIERPPAPMA